MARGRPSEYTAERGAEICRLIAEGATIRDIVAMDGMPAWETIRRWCDTFPEFQAQYARAYEQSAHALSDEALAVVRAANDSESAQVARVRLDAVKWLAGKRNPKVYGEKVAVENSGTIGWFAQGTPESPSSQEWAQGVALADAKPMGNAD